MSILIHELEIVPPPAGGSSEGPAATAAPPAEGERQGVEASDVQTLVARREKRRLRVWAH